MTNEPAVILQNVTKRFARVHQNYASLKGMLLSFMPRRVDEKTILNDVSLTINAGETVAVIGPNGAGKSTLLGLLAKVYKPNSGKVIVHGRIAPMLELGAGFHPDLTGVENIYFNAVILGLTKAQVRERLDEIIAYSELKDYIDTPIHTYSSGMLMRLGFSVASHVSADVLLIDEVLAVGDVEFQAKCYRKIREFQSQGKTILFVTHNMNDVRRAATRVVWLENGTIVQDGEVDEVVSAYLRKHSAENNEI